MVRNPCAGHLIRLQPAHFLLRPLRRLVLLHALMVNRKMIPMIM